MMGFQRPSMMARRHDRRETVKASANHGIQLNKQSSQTLHHIKEAELVAVDDIELEDEQ